MQPIPAPLSTSGTLSYLFVSPVLSQMLCTSHHTFHGCTIGPEEFGMISVGQRSHHFLGHRNTATENCI